VSENVSRYRGRFLLEKDGVSWLGGQRMDLLEAIAEHGSITEAAKAVGVSYRGAWDTIDAMNNQCELPLVERVVGGRHGGGTRLTEHGQRLVKLFRAIEGDYQRALSTLAGNLEDFAEFQRLLRKYSLTTSARNQFSGRISAISLGEVFADVRIRLDAGNELVAVVTLQSVDKMELKEGKEVYALFKAGAVVLTTAQDPVISFENRLCGKIGSVQKGLVYTEISVRLMGEKTIVSVVNNQVAEQMGLVPGLQVCALFNAANVILALI